MLGICITQLYPYNNNNFREGKLKKASGREVFAEISGVF